MIPLIQLTLWFTEVFTGEFGQTITNSDVKKGTTH